jgi:hypothetical protein
VADDIMEHSITCSACGALYTSDMSEEELQELGLRRLCESCRQQKFGEALELDILDVIERRLGLTAEDQEILKALVTIVGNQDRALMVARAMDRVDALDRRLEDKTAALESKLESKLDNMDSRLWTSSWVANGALFLCGVLAGVVGTLIFGG